MQKLLYGDTKWVVLCLHDERIPFLEWYHTEESIREHRPAKVSFMLRFKVISLEDFKYRYILNLSFALGKRKIGASIFLENKYPLTFFFNEFRAPSLSKICPCQSSKFSDFGGVLKCCLLLLTRVNVSLSISYSLSGTKINFSFLTF